MKFYYLLAVVSLVLFTTTASFAHGKQSEGNEKWTFESAKIGTTPMEWTAGVTGAKAGKAPRWEVIEDNGRKVLGQLESGGANGDFPVCLKRGSTFKNGTVSIRFKSISGRVDQAGGVVFRAKDKDNFYIARANALENNVSFYVTVDGKRKTIKYWRDIEVKLGVWHELKVEVKDSTFKVWLNDKYVGQIEDTKKTLNKAGMVGAWTKADSVTYFDELKVGPPVPRLQSVKVDKPPGLDGKADESQWADARPLEVTATRVFPPNQGASASVKIRSVHTDTHVYFLVTWKDSEASVSHKTWTWNPETDSYIQGDDREDMFALAFEHRGTFNVNMLSGDTGSWDVWHWKALRSNPQGYAMDKTHHYTLKKPSIKAKSYKAANGKTIWIARPEDEGDSVERKRAAPNVNKGAKVVQFVPGKPSGSASDVLAKGSWSDGQWTLELGRKLNTKHRDDTVFELSRSYKMAMSMFDHTGNMDKATGVIELTWIE